MLELSSATKTNTAHKIKSNKKIQYHSGFCTKLGVRSSNEDRYVSYEDLKNLKTKSSNYCQGFIY